MHRALGKCINQKINTNKEKGTRLTHFSKVVNLKLGNPNIFLVYSCLILKGMESNKGIHD